MKLWWCKGIIMNYIHHFSNKFSVYFSGRVNLPDAWFEADQTFPTGWTHVVLNYIGPNNGQGIKVYFNGKESVARNIRTGSATFQNGDRQVVVGRLLSNKDHSYASAQIDELIYFDTSLDILQIKAIYDSYWNLWNKFLEHFTDAFTGLRWFFWLFLICCKCKQNYCRRNNYGYNCAVVFRWTIDCDIFKGLTSYVLQ